jgi:hypothetical protein
MMRGRIVELEIGKNKVEAGEKVGRAASGFPSLVPALSRPIWLSSENPPGLDAIYFVLTSSRYQ